MEPTPRPELISSKPVAVPMGEGDEQTQITLEVGGTIKRTTLAGESTWRITGFIGSKVLLTGVDGLAVDGRDNLIRITPFSSDTATLQEAATSYLGNAQVPQTDALEA